MYLWTNATSPGFWNPNCEPKFSPNTQNLSHSISLRYYNIISTRANNWTSSTRIQTFLDIHALSILGAKCQLSEILTLLKCPILVKVATSYTRIRCEIETVTNRIDMVIMCTRSCKNYRGKYYQKITIQFSLCSDNLDWYNLYTKFICLFWFTSIIIIASSYYAALYKKINIIF